MKPRTPQAHMVDIRGKPESVRSATASAKLALRSASLKAIEAKTVEKGDVLEVARTAAIMAIKATPQILPLTHPIPIESADVDFLLLAGHVEVRVTVAARARTGVEMEALVGASVALLTVWDLVKPLEKDSEGQYPKTRLDDLRILRKEKFA